MLICVDFQPAYSDAFPGMIPALKKRLRKAARAGQSVHFIYNDVFSLEGEPLGDSFDSLLLWTKKHRLRLDNAKLIRKNFGWVSPCLRDGVERKIGVEILRHILSSGLQHSGQLSEIEISSLIAKHCDIETFQNTSMGALAEIRCGAVALPMTFEGGVISWLESLKCHDVEVVGGFRERCLDEICMLFDAFGISHTVNEALVYSLPGTLAPEHATTDSAPVTVLPSLGFAIA